MDIASCEALEAALNDYDGTIITVSHDRYFLDRIANKILFFGTDGVEFFDGSYSEFYDAHHQAKRDEADAIKAAAEAQRKAETQKKQAPKPAPKSNQKNKAKGANPEEIEAKIHATETELQKISAQLSSEDIARDKARLFELSEKYAQLEEQLKELFASWEVALSKV